MDEQNIIDNKFKSPATKYEIILVEIAKKSNSKDEKIVKVFEILDQILPHLGVYLEIMKMVKQQLFDAVFSNYDYSGATLPADNKSNLQRMSFYTLYKQLLNSRDEKNDQLKLELQAKETELKGKNIEIEEHKAMIDDINDKLKDALKTVEQREREINSKNRDIARLEKKLEDTEEELKNIIENLENDIKTLNNEFNQRNKEIESLMVYKKAYDDVYNKFSAIGNDESVKYQKKHLISTRKNQVSNDILNAKKLEEQILTLINISTEEYDKYIENENESLARKSDHQSRMGLVKRSEYINNEAEKINYRKSIESLKNEYDMVVQHRLSLEEKLYYLEIDKETAEFLKRQKGKATNPQTASANNKGNTATAGLEEHYDPVRKGADRDQFNLQDRVFSKWACLLQTSPNGNMWFDLKELKFCENCGGKTLICPHRMSANEAVISIPHDTQFLKFTRPKLQYNQMVVKRALDSYKKQVAQIVPNTSLLVNENTLVLTNYTPEFVLKEDENQNEECIRLLTEGDPEIGMPHNIQRIWYDYSQKTSFKREVPRPFTFDRTLSVIKQFLVYLHKKEVYTDLAVLDVVASLYEYFEKRYELEEIKFAAIYDFYSSINFYACYSRFIEIFCHVLIGNLDRGILNYIFYMAEVIDKIEWTEADDARIFFAIVYPYCDDDDLDNLALDYISFSENKINKKLVWDFILMLIVKRREPLVNEVEFRLSTKVTLQYAMTEQEFCQVMEEFFFINDEKQVRLSYLTALAHCFWDSYDLLVPLTKLSHIGAYYCLMQIISELQDTVDKILADHRNTILENELRNGGAPLTKANQLVEVKGEFIKISDIDKSQSLI